MTATWAFLSRVSSYLCDAGVIRNQAVYREAGRRSVGGRSDEARGSLTAGRRRTWIGDGEIEMSNAIVVLAVAMLSWG